MVIAANIDQKVTKTIVQKGAISGFGKNMSLLAYEDLGPSVDKNLPDNTVEIRDFQEYKVIAECSEEPPDEEPPWDEIEPPWDLMEDPTETEQD